MLRKTLLVIAILFLAMVAYLLLAPVPVAPEAWNAPQDAGYVGAHARNTRLAGLTMIAMGGATGPEHVALGPDGKLYAAVDGGKIVRMNADGSAPEVWAATGGRVLGFDFDARGRLIAADAMRGVLALEAGAGLDAGKKAEVLVDKVKLDDGDDPIRYADAVVVAKDGKIYFTDASRRFGAKEWGGTFEASVLDIIEHAATGRVLVHDPVSHQTEVVMNDLAFANGLALSADEKSLFVAETGEYRVWKVDVNARVLSAKASASGTSQARLVLSNLPGYPDNLMRGMQGRIWLGFTKPRGAAIDKMAGKPFLRKITMRLPKSMWPVPPAYGHVIAFDEDGKIVADLQDPSGAYPETTGVTETSDRLYIQSLHAPALGWMEKARAGLKPL
ncbi:SMP-30/gluconolactonase/LRE family protein [Herbaspirillum sp. ST 5-3]|uniref:SMP-30/gluconolactonase/LRE family protein n=1 Tax=Oxalobacteraceae TaxID=75682 RepID=UPI0010A4A7FC|nr:SMP-30/gluconolactonase/LRE family protein [Herbaspirillum sp. ST 5-3]